jgi:hypothetical protein
LISNVGAGALDPLSGKGKCGASITRFGRT